MYDILEDVLKVMNRSLATVEAGLLSFCEYAEFLQMLSVVMVALTIALPFLNFLLERVWCWRQHNLTRAMRLSWVVATLVTLAYTPLSARPLREFTEAVTPAFSLVMYEVYGNEDRRKFFDDHQDFFEALTKVVADESPGLSCLDRASTRKKWYYQLAAAPAIAWLRATDREWAKAELVRPGRASSDLKKIFEAGDGSEADLVLALKNETFRTVVARDMASETAASCVGDPKIPTLVAVVALICVWCATSTLWLLLSLLFAYVWLKPRGEGEPD